MPKGLLDEVEQTVDELVRLALEDLHLGALATHRWMADLDEADSLEQVFDSHRYLLNELQRIAAADFSRRLQIMATWFGGGAEPTDATVDAVPVQRDEANAPGRVSSDEWLPLEPWTMVTLAGAALDATRLKALRDVLYGPDAIAARQTDRPASDRTGEPTSATKHAEAAPRPAAAVGTTRAPRRAGNLPHSGQSRLSA